MSTIHFNIAKKQEVNPFENVTFVKLLTDSESTAIASLKRFLNKNSQNVETRKVKDEFVILYNVSTLNFTTLLEWIAPMRGRFYFDNRSIHFLIEGDLMSCW